MQTITEEWRKFVSEYCGEYAIALHERFGLPIYVLKGYSSADDYSIGYAFVSSDGGRTGIDARGIVSVDELRATCAFAGRPRWMSVSRISRENLAWELGGVEEEILAEARQIVAETYPGSRGRVGTG